MVLVLKNDQMENLLPMSEEIDAIEQAYLELGQGKAMNAPRARLRTPWKEEGGQYYFNNIMGLVPGMKSMALRIDSSFSKEIQVDGAKRRVYPGDFIGLVMLFDMDTCNILALMDDHYISAMRVGATSAVASKYLARQDAKTMGLIGSGEQARTQVTAHACVRRLTKVKVYSPTKANREKFAKEMSQQTGIEIIPVDSAEAAIRGSDIVTAATNTVDPVIQGKWLEPGMHLNSIVGGDGFLPRKELDDEAVMKANLIVVGFKAQIFLDKQAEFHDRLERGLVKADDLH
ncbi:MAG TPA: ornithine cyclodeaminase family protein, partial [Acidobacteriota bacterium]|nr:ornithine cyclodeaminase family protein [Acidobacteriota bacterium]